MSVGTPETEQTVIDNISVDVARAAPDSNPYLRVHWLNSLINGHGRRIFDFYGDLKASEKRLMPDTADSETAVRWGAIFGKTKIPASQASGNAVVQGVAGGTVPLGTTLTSGSDEYTTTSSGTVSAQSIQVQTITRSGSIATLTTVNDHSLASSVPVTISGAVETEYNVSSAVITVTGLKTITYAVIGTPATPATGTILAAFTSASIPVVSSGFGDSANLSLDAPLSLQSPIVNVNDALSVDFGAIGGGTDEEANEAFKLRYLDRIQNPVAHFNIADITDKAKEVAGVTRVFVDQAGTEINSVSITSINRSGSVATAVTSSAHGFVSGQVTTIEGAVQPDYNVEDAFIIVESTTIFHYIVTGAPATPATGTITSTTSIPMGQVITYFMRDNDSNPIPTASEVTKVKDKLDEILPANTSTLENIVLSPVGVPVNFVFSQLIPDTTTMRTAIQNNLQQFFDEQTSIGLDVDEDLYRAAIANTIDTETGDKITRFDLSAPTINIVISSGQIATLGGITF